jgi:hypothetical protein
VSDDRGGVERPPPRRVRKVRVEDALWYPAMEKAREEEGTTISAKIRGFLIRFLAGEDS